MKKILAVVLFLFILLSYTASFGFEIYSPPEIRVELSGSYNIGVKTEGTVERSFESSENYEDRFSNENDITNKYSVTNTSSSSFSNEYSDEQTSKPMPSGGSFISDLASALGGDYAPFFKHFGDAVDYACSPYNDKWSNIYTRKSGQTTNASDSHTVDASQKDSANWLVQTSSDFKQKYSTDINKGYLRCGVRLTNVGKTGVDIKNPLFAIYFISPKKRYLAGMARAFQEKPDSEVTVRIGAGKSADFQLNLENQDYINLINEYAHATEIVLELQDVTTLVNEKPISLDAVIEDKSESGVFVRMLSDGRKYEKYVYLGDVNEISVTDLLNVLDLKAQTNKVGDPITFWVTAIDPEENV